jgi:dethiobiotin synthetase
MGAHTRGVFIAGTDTEVGKTYVTTAVVRALVRSGRRVGVMKPVAAGAEATPEGLRNADALALMKAANVPAPYATVNPFCLAVPTSPHIAARMAGIRIDLATIQQHYLTLVNGPGIDVVAVEGAGGWHAPISETETMADVARTLQLPVLIVVGLRLGCLNHALLTAQAIEAAGLQLAGWIANHVQPHFEHAGENIALLERRLHAPLLESVAFNASAFGSVTAMRRLADASRLW